MLQMFAAQHPAYTGESWLIYVCLDKSMYPSPINIALLQNKIISLQTEYSSA